MRIDNILNNGHFLLINTGLRNLFFFGCGHFNIFPFIHLLQEPDKIIDFRFGTFPNKIPDDILNLVKEGLILFFAISVISFLECVYQGKGGFSWTYIVAVVLVKAFVTSSVKLVWAVDVS